MGQHMLPPGKETAFDSDIKVPLIVVGPGVPAGATVDAVTENVDLCPTFAELAGAAPPATTEGRSLVALMRGGQSNDWRDMALVEHKGPDLVPSDPSDPDNEGGPRPNSYEALRLADALYVEYASGEREYYDLASDPYETRNTVASLPAERARVLREGLANLRHCHGAEGCWQAQKL
jgi:arylsulfatase A-like enzyme